MTWTLNMALHREVAARVRSSGDGMQQADAAAEIRQLLGAPRLVLLRDGVDVVNLSWSEAMVNLGESLGTPLVAPSGSVADADIDSGTWVARLESADGVYAATTTSVGKSGTDVIVADDIDASLGVSVSITLAMDDDLSSGGGVLFSPGDGIYQLGDSTTYGHNSIDGNQVATPAPKALENELGGVYPVTFEGVGLATTSDLIAGTGGFSNSLANLLAASPAKVVIYPWGINDSYLISDSQFEENLRTIVATTRSAGKIPILQTPNPTTQNLSPELAIIRSVASDLGVPLIDVHAYLTQQLGGAPVTTMMPDGYHPSQATYLLIGAYQAGRIRDIFAIDIEPDPERDLRYYPFRADSPWNTKIPAYAIWRGPSDPRTARVRSNSGGPSGSDTDPGTIVWALNFDDYTFYTWYASNNDPLVTINSGGQPWQVRCPSNAVPSTGTDMHMCIIDPDGLHSHDMWGAQRSGNTINAAAYIKTRLDGMGWRMTEERLRTQANPRGINFDNASAGRGGPRAVSAAALGGLIRRKHLDDGVIPHALAFACPRRWAKGGIGVRVWPADEIIGWGDSDDGRPPYFSGDIPYSTRFGLDKNVDVNSLGLSREWTIIAKALQDYGMYLVDVAGPVNPCLYAEYPLVKQGYPNLKNQQTTSFNKIIPHMMALDWT